MNKSDEKKNEEPPHEHETKQEESECPECGARHTGGKVTRRGKTIVDEDLSAENERLRAALAKRGEIKPPESEPDEPEPDEPEPDESDDLTGWGV